MKHSPLTDGTCIYCQKKVIEGTPAYDEACPKHPKAGARPMVSAMEDVDTIHNRILELRREQAAEWAK